MRWLLRQPEEIWYENRTNISLTKIRSLKSPEVDDSLMCFLTLCSFYPAVI